MMLQQQGNKNQANILRFALEPASSRAKRRMLALCPVSLPSTSLHRFLFSVLSTWNGKRSDPPAPPSAELFPPAAEHRRRVQEEPQVLGKPFQTFRLRLQAASGLLQPHLTQHIHSEGTLSAGPYPLSATLSAGFLSLKALSCIQCMLLLSIKQAAKVSVCCPQWNKAPERLSLCFLRREGTPPPLSFHGNTDASRGRKKRTHTCSTKAFSD